MRRVLVAAALLLAASFAAGCAAQEEKKAKDLVIELPEPRKSRKKTMHRPAEKRKAHGMRKKQRLRIRRKREF